MINRTEKEIMEKWKGDINRPIVSICTVTYNHEEYIEEAIDSFLIQETDFVFEIVIGEDCSTDGTRKIIDEYIKNYPNIIKLVTSERNVGGQKNGQRIYAASRGKYIALCEGDDYWTDNKKLHIQIEEMRKYPDIDFSFHLASTINNFNDEIKPQLQEKNRLYTLREIITGDFHLVQTNTIVIKKKKIENLNFDLLSKSPVGDVWLRINGSMPNGALFVNRVMSTYRIKSQGSWSQSLQEENEFLNFASNMIKSIDDFDKYWNYTYTDDFKIYKNMFVEAVMKNNISQESKENFIFIHKNLISIKNFLRWHFLYKYLILVKYLKIFKNLLKVFKNVQTNIK